MSTDSERVDSDPDTKPGAGTKAETPSLASVPGTEEGIRAIIDGALFASTEPLTTRQLCNLFDPGQAVTEARVTEALDSLTEANADRGIELVRSGRGYRYRTRPGLSPWLNRLWEERPRKLSRAMMETLALIAYRQPITRGEIEDVRGVSVGSTIIRNLMDFDWIRVSGYRDVPGRPALFATTDGFLESFGLQTLDDLPPLSDIKSLAELEPELDFGGDDPVSAPPEPRPGEESTAADDPVDAWTMEPAFAGADLAEIDRINTRLETGWQQGQADEDADSGQQEPGDTEQTSATQVEHADGSNLTEAEQLAIIEQKLKQQQAQLSGDAPDAGDASDSEGTR